MYGQTEAGPRMSILNWKMFYKKLNSVGHPLKDYKFKIIPEKNKTRTNKRGEVVFYGDSVCLGYAKNSNDLKKGDINKKSFSLVTLDTRTKINIYTLSEEKQNL